MVDTLTQQEQSISGVSLDEEAANMLQYQQLYQASAHYLSTVSQLMKSLLSYTASRGLTHENRRQTSATQLIQAINLQSSNMSSLEQQLSTGI